jgi:hypothetical protein
MPRITQYQFMTLDEVLNFAENRVETPLEVELFNRLLAVRTGGVAHYYGAMTTNRDSEVRCV